MLRKRMRRLVAILIMLIMVLGLAACGNNGTPQNNNGSGNDGGTGSNSQSDSQTNAQAAPGTILPNTDAAADSALYGIWVDAPGIFVFDSGFAMLYEFGSADINGYRAGYIKGLYDCSYELNGNTLSVSAYDLSGELFYSGEYTLEGDVFRDEYNEYVKVSDNHGEIERITGTWYSVGDMFELGNNTITGSAYSGTEMHFYNDGTCCARWEDGSGDDDGTYLLTSKFDSPAISLIDGYGFEAGTYHYEFLSNDLLMIYVDDDGFGGYVFYRAS